MGVGSWQGSLTPEGTFSHVSASLGQQNCISLSLEGLPMKSRKSRGANLKNPKIYFYGQFLAFFRDGTSSYLKNHFKKI